uniref:CSON005034 protein n=1 Tax=Culicoides sonorensis TaxID=179676 RepID=A0A336MSD5_CULSO
MSQGFFVVQTIKGLNLLENPSLKSHNVYSIDKLHGLELARISHKPAFIQLYDDQKSIELVRVKAFDGISKIEKLKKMSHAEVMTSIAGPKVKQSEIAIGYASGHVRLINIQSSQRTKSFNPEIVNNQVGQIDFNCEDEYLVVLYDNGNVRTFNTKSGIQCEKIKVDDSVGVVKYHTTKPQVIGLGFRTGSLQVWDSLKKRAIFKDTEAHSAPVRDIAWDATNPDLFYSAGFDCAVKVVDIRKRFCGIKITNEHVINCMHVSNCGNFIATGNLIGKVHLYDTRNPKVAVSEGDLSGGDQTIKIQRILGVAGNPDVSLNSNSSASNANNNNTKNVTEDVEETLPENVTSCSDVDDLLTELHNKKRVSIDMTDVLPNRPSISGRRYGRLSADFGSQNLLRYLDDSNDSVGNVTQSPIVEAKLRSGLENPIYNSTMNQFQPISTTPKTSISRVNSLKKVEEIEENESFATPPNSMDSQSYEETNSKNNNNLLVNIPTCNTSTPNIPLANAVTKQMSQISVESSKDTPPTMTDHQTSSQILSVLNSINSRLDNMDQKFDEMNSRIEFVENHVMIKLHQILKRQDELEEKIESVMLNTRNQVTHQSSSTSNRGFSREILHPNDLPLNPHTYDELLEGNFYENWKKYWERKLY